MVLSFREQLIEVAKKGESHKGGTYVGANVSAKSRRDIQSWVNDHNIPNAADPKQYHTTLIYSRKGIPEVKDYKFDFPMTGTITGFKIFPNGDKRCLVAIVDSDQLHEHHNAIRSLYGATHDFPDYNPHVTLSYDYNTPGIPKLDSPIPIEYTTINIEPLDEDYTA